MENLRFQREKSSRLLTHVHLLITKRYVKFPYQPVIVPIVQEFSKKIREINFCIISNGSLKDFLVKSKNTEQRNSISSLVIKTSVKLTEKFEFCWFSRQFDEDFFEKELAMILTKLSLISRKNWYKCNFHYFLSANRQTKGVIF